MDICRTMLIRLVLLTKAGESSEAPIITAKSEDPVFAEQSRELVTHLLPLFGLASGNDPGFITGSYSQTHSRSHLENLSCVACAQSSPTCRLRAYKFDHSFPGLPVTRRDHNDRLAGPNKFGHQPVDFDLAPTRFHGLAVEDQEIRLGQ